MSKVTAKITPLVAALAFALLPLVAIAQPPTGPVVAEGDTVLIPPPNSALPNIACHTTLTGTISGPPNYDITVSTASFAPGDSQCVALQAKNLPWWGTFNPSFTQLIVHNVTVAVPILGLICGPATVIATYVAATNTVQFGPVSNPTPLGACAIAGSLHF